MAQLITDGMDCPCYSGHPFDDCCRVVLDDPRSAATAEALMRSRYTATALGNVRHLYLTWHPRTRPDNIQPSANAWLRLEVLDVADGQPGDLTGEVEFKATYNDYRVRIHHERSLFEWRANRWMYVEAIEDLSPPRWNTMTP